MGLTQNRNVTDCSICQSPILRANQQFCCAACKQKAYRNRASRKTFSPLTEEELNLVNQITDQLLEAATEQGLARQDLALALIYKQLKEQLENFPLSKQVQFATRLISETLAK